MRTSNVLFILVISTIRSRIYHLRNFSISKNYNSTSMILNKSSSLIMHIRHVHISFAWWHIRSLIGHLLSLLRKNNVLKIFNLILHILWKIWPLSRSVLSDHSVLQQICDTLLMYRLSSIVSMLDLEVDSLVRSFTAFNISMIMASTSSKMDERDMISMKIGRKCIGC